MIRFYIDGTTGQKDGTEVTSINPITATGLFPSGSTAASKSVKVYIRADAGESYRQVLVGVNADKFTKCRITSFNNSITQTIGLTGGYRVLIANSGGHTRCSNYKFLSEMP